MSFFRFIFVDIDKLHTFLENLLKAFKTIDFCKAFYGFLKKFRKLKKSLEIVG